MNKSLVERGVAASKKRDEIREEVDRILGLAHGLVRSHEVQRNINLAIHDCLEWRLQARDAETSGYDSFYFIGFIGGLGAIISTNPKKPKKVEAVWLTFVHDSLGPLMEGLMQNLPSFREDFAKFCSVLPTEEK